MNNYIMLLIMKEWFYLNALWKVKKISWKEVYDEKKSCYLKIRVSEVLLHFKDKASDESTNLC